MLRHTLRRSSAPGHRFTKRWGAREIIFMADKFVYFSPHTFPVDYNLHFGLPDGTASQMRSHLQIQNTSIYGKNLFSRNYLPQKAFRELFNAS